MGCYPHLCWNNPLRKMFIILLPSPLAGEGLGMGGYFAGAATWGFASILVSCFSLSQ